MGRVLLILLAFLTVNQSFGQNKTIVSFNNNDNSQLHEAMEKNISFALTGLNIAFKESVIPDFRSFPFTDFARERIKDLWNTSPFFSPEIDIKESLLNVPNGGYQIRNIPLLMKNGEGNTINQEAVINFNSYGMIEDLYFGIEQTKYKSLIGMGTDVQDFRRRQIILDFIENFRTAYNRKDIELIEKTFSNNALIIVGKVMKELPDSPQMLESLGEKRAQFIKYSKQQYISNLSRVFIQNHLIDVRFDDIQIIKHPSFQKIYGVNLKQSWKSSTYSDEGFLFLMIDFENENQPLIHVRSWQPFSNTQRKDVIELGDFEIVK